MLHLAAFCPPQSGHMNPFLALTRAIIRRGHRVTYFGFLDTEPRMRRSGLGFRALGVDAFPLGRAPKMIAELGEKSGFRALLHTLKLGIEQAEALMRDAPAALREEKVDGVLIDQACPGVESAVEYVGLPQVSVANILMFNYEPDVPPFITTWLYSTRLWPRLRNRLVYFSGKFTGAQRLLAAVNRQRREWGIPPIRDPASQKHLSQLAQVAQMPEALDFPRRHLPRVFHYCGAWTDPEERAPVPFPWERLDGRPMIYCSLGTVQNRLNWFFEAIARECDGLGCQLVISLGGGGSPDEYKNLPGDPIVVAFAPQLDLLKKASLLICHGGLNSTLEAVQLDLPVVAIPITNDQPGVASRIAYSGLGEFVLPKKLKKHGVLKAAVARVLKEPSYKQNAIRIHESVRAAGGAERAAEICIQALTTRQPVYARPEGADKA